MTQTVLQRAFAPLKAHLPRPIANFVRSSATAILTPILFSYHSGHFLSSFKMEAVSSTGDPLPWYTYPCIEFLNNRSYEGKTVLEFGGGQSTLWWAKRAKQVVTLEGSSEWYERIKNSMPENVDLHCVSEASASDCVAQVEAVLRTARYSTFDVIVIDGLYRSEMIEIAKRLMAEEGMIVCDDAEGYGFFEGFKESGMNRVDFFGNAPGVVLSHTTSIFFKSRCFAFSSECPMSKNGP